jgi:hypothetical protein
MFSAQLLNIERRNIMETNNTRTVVTLSKEEAEILIDALSQKGSTYLQATLREKLERRCNVPALSDIRFITVYDIDDCYGGPEEGGWYYIKYTVTAVESIRGTLAELHAAYLRVCKEWMSETSCDVLDLDTFDDCVNNPEIETVVTYGSQTTNDRCVVVSYEAGEFEDHSVRMYQ